MAHGPQPGMPWGLSYDEDMVIADLQTGVDSNTSEGADEAVGPDNDLREALGDLVDELQLVCDASRPAHQYCNLRLASAVCSACHVRHKSP